MERFQRWEGLFEKGHLLGSLKLNAWCGAGMFTGAFGAALLLGGDLALSVGLGAIFSAGLFLVLLAVNAAVNRKN